AEPMLVEGNVFMAVGAMHLIGDEGLVELFRQKGYTVTAIK
ncbi:MAG: polysaccharide biosynthesis protein, partial [Rhizobium sp.]|nr:polysaccharide biosynthesis protein [Rhizobium sp.]